MARHSHPWFRKSDGWWYVKIAGAPVKLVRGLDSKQAAIDRWHDLMTERSKNPPVESRNHTVASVIDLFLTHSKRNCASTTYELRAYYLQLFAEAHGFRRIDQALPIHLTNWLDANAQWKSDWTRAGVVAMVHRPFNWAARQRVIPNNPFRGVVHRPGEPRRAITDEEYRALLRATASSKSNRWPRVRPPKRPTRAARFRQVLVFLRNTGARPGEMSALTWSDINLQAGVVVLRKHKTSRTQRTPKPRVILLVPMIVRLLARMKEQQPIDQKLVFATTRRTPWNRSSLGLRMRRLRLKARVPADAKLYGIRHQFGTQSIMNGVDIKTLSVLMGHTSTRMTEHYCHLAGQTEHLAAAMQRAVSKR